MLVYCNLHFIGCFLIKFYFQFLIKKFITNKKVRLYIIDQVTPIYCTVLITMRGNLSFCLVQSLVFCSFFFGYFPAFQS